MSTSDSKNSSATLRNVIFGVVLMFGGTYASVTNVVPGREALDKMGLELDFGMTFATIGVFLILFPMIKGFFLVPLQNAIQERNTNLERTFSEVEELKSEMQTLRADYEKRLAATEAEAREHIQSQIKEAQQLRATLIEEATAKTEALVSQAQSDIATERDQLIGELRSHVVELALGAATKIVGENMDSDKNRRMVDDFIAAAGVAS